MNEAYLLATPYLLQRAKREIQKNTGSSIRFCNLATCIEITYMLVAIEPRRFGKHKTNHIILQKMRVQIHDVIDKNEHFHLQSTPCANVWTGAKVSNRITLKKQSFLIVTD